MKGTGILVAETTPSDCEAAFEVVEGPLVLLDRALRIRRLNRSARALAGQPAESLAGRPIEAVGPGAIWQKAAALVARLEPGGTVQGQVEDPRAARAWSLLVTDTGQEGPIVVAAQDITVLIRLQDSQRHIERLGALGALLHVAHQVRNPLFAISGAVDAFEARFGASEASARYFEVLRHNVARVTTLMQELLDYAKPAPADLRVGSVAGVLEAALAACAPLAERSGVALVLEVDAALPGVRLDRERLAQCFENLVENAVQHSPRGATVVVQARAPAEGDGWVECRVVDAGPGVRDLARIFEPFFTGRRGGVGLGLAIAQRIVECHGGSLEAINRAEGGAVFRVLLRAC